MLIPAMVILPHSPHPPAMTLLEIPRKVMRKVSLGFKASK
jgi:hypothetical protein